MTSRESTQQIRESWNRLGFYYDRDDDRKAWRIMGSRTGLLEFSRLLAEFARDPRHEPLSEHEHYGPYWYLELMTWSSACIDRHAIKGSLEDLSRLAQITSETVCRAAAGAATVIDKEYSSQNEYVLELVVESESFNPADADSLIR